jgi:hypothetical protein
VDYLHGKRDNFTMNEHNEPTTLHEGAARLQQALKDVFVPPAMLLVIGTLKLLTAAIRTLTSAIDAWAARRRKKETDEQ